MAVRPCTAPILAHAHEPVQARVLPVPVLRKPSTHAHVEDPAVLVLPYGQDVHADPATLYLFAEQTEPAPSTAIDLAPAAYA